MPRHRQYAQSGRRALLIHHASSSGRAKTIRRPGRRRLSSTRLSPAVLNMGLLDQRIVFSRESQMVGKWYASTESPSLWFPPKRCGALRIFDQVSHFRTFCVRCRRVRYISLEGRRIFLEEFHQPLGRRCHAYRQQNCKRSNTHTSQHPPIQTARNESMLKHAH